MKITDYELKRRKRVEENRKEMEKRRIKEIADDLKSKKNPKTKEKVSL